MLTINKTESSKVSFGSRLLKWGNVQNVHCIMCGCNLLSDAQRTSWITEARKFSGYRLINLIDTVFANQSKIMQETKVLKEVTEIIKKEHDARDSLTLENVCQRLYTTVKGRITSQDYIAKISSTLRKIELFASQHSRRGDDFSPLIEKSVQYYERQQGFIQKLRRGSSASACKNEGDFLRDRGQFLLERTLLMAAQKTGSKIDPQSRFFQKR